MSLLFTQLVMLLGAFMMGGALLEWLEQSSPHPLTEADTDELRQAVAGHPDLEVKRFQDSEGATFIQISGLLTKLELGRERLFEHDIAIGDPEFDDVVYWQVWGNSSPAHERDADFLSGLDWKTREQLRSLIDYGACINLGGLTMAASVPRNGLEAADAKAQLMRLLTDITATLAANRQKDGTTIVSRLTNLALTDPSMGFRRTCLRVLLTLVQKKIKERRDLLRTILTQDDAISVTETIAIDALNDVSHVRALAAAHWLQHYGTKAQPCNPSHTR